MDRMSMEEFAAWIAYSEIEPFGEAREDLRAGIMWASFATVHSDSKKNPRGIGIDKYPLFAMQKRLDGEATQATPQSLFRAMKMLSAVYKKRQPS